MPPTPADPANAATPPELTRQALWALLFGNFVIGTGVMVVPGALNDLSRGLGVPVSSAGQLISAGAVVMCLGAPLMAGLIGAWDRRRLLVLAMLWYAIGHALCAAMPHLAALLPVRALTMLAAAVFTPQAAAVAGYLARAHKRGSAITFIFLGWSMASVAGLPLAAWIGETLGWRAAMAGVAALAVPAAWWVHHALPRGVRPQALSMRNWLDVLSHPVLMATVGITVLLGTGQFTLFSYFAPYFASRIGAGAGQLGALFLWFGVFGVLGNLWVSRHIDRHGADRIVTMLALCIAVSLLMWPLGVGWWSFAVILVPWALGCFSSNSAQQARLGHAAPALAPALMALNTSAIYLGQAAGAASGGWLVARGPADNPFLWLSWAGLAWVALGLALSVWVARRRREGTVRGG